MTSSCHINLGTPALLAFRGPDALRYLNGQLTQDVRNVMDGEHCLPSCLTDAKGRLQFRVWIHSRVDCILVEGPADDAEALEARLTRYLIADDVEVENLSGRWQLHHLIHDDGPTPEGGLCRKATRFGLPGCDWWLPAEATPQLPPDCTTLDGDALETLRITQGIPAWGSELIEGMLPPEAGLDATDISYNKGCYIGQEVISRIKFAGKMNRRMARLTFDAAIPTTGLQLVDANGEHAGDLTSIAPLATGSIRHALAYLKRNSEATHLRLPDGSMHVCQKMA
jgi:folate-binding protein YgfZ